MPNDIYKPVTEDSLRAFYQQIQPYLNADVPVIANKFDKANLYSETEKIVGQWIDGKPLYQKTIDLTSNSPKFVWASEHAFTSVVINPQNYGFFDSANVARIIRCAGSMINSAGTATYGNVITGVCLISSMQWQLYGTDDYYGTDVTIQYTKTTDQPISIGADTDYSTTEKVIGTWIDGKPLYQKTLSNLTGFSANNNSFVHGIVNLGKVTHLTGIVVMTSGNSCVYPRVNDTSAGSILDNGVDSTNVNIWCGSSIPSQISSIDLTIQYTKTTD